MLKSTVEVTKYEFEVGDLFVWVKDVPGCAYDLGDFMRIKALGFRGGVEFDTSLTCLGKTSMATGSEGWLTEELEAGHIKYIPLGGNK